MVIQSITSRQILDSRGHPTLETTVHCDAGISGTAAVPSGASTGSHEAVELRDDNPQEFGGLGVRRAMANVTGPIAKALVGQDVRQARLIDQTMIDLDGTVNKSSLGANAILSVSLAAARARANLAKQPLYRSLQSEYEFPDIDAHHLPQPMMNILNGGKHADTAVKIQEYLILPAGDSVAQRIIRGAAVYQQLKTILHQQKLSTLLGDEGGFAPALQNDEQGLALITQAIEAAGLRWPDEVALGLDLAATEFYDTATQRYQFGDVGGGLAAAGMVGRAQEWLAKYQLRTIEDLLAEDDWQGWTDATALIGGHTTLIGDDLFVTNKARLERGVTAKAANAILIKLNQIGTLSETMDTIHFAQDHQYAVVVSHRSGETMDDFIADLAVAVGAPWIKAGAPARGERVAKYNRLLAIEQELTA